MTQGSNCSRYVRPKNLRPGHSNDAVDVCRVSGRNHLSRGETLHHCALSPFHLVLGYTTSLRVAIDRNPHLARMGIIQSSPLRSAIFTACLSNELSYADFLFAELFAAGFHEPPSSHRISRLRLAINDSRVGFSSICCRSAFPLRKQQAKSIIHLGRERAPYLASCAHSAAV
jgi:hypothetical protein